MLTRSSGYTQALARPHRAYVRVDVHAGDGTLLQADLPFLSGAVAATLTSRVARRLNISVSEDFYPMEATDLITPYGNELRAYRGIEYGDGLTEYWPVFRGRIEDVSLDSAGKVDVVALDRAADVVAAEFEAPTISPAGLVVDAYRLLVQDAVADAAFNEDDLELILETAPRLIFESDRAGACDDLAATAGAFWYPLADGTFTMIKIPWTRGVQPALYTLADGPDGMVLASSLSRSRSSVLNSVSVYTERTDGSPPLFHIARDDDPDSPTSVVGNFGLRSKQLPVQTPTSSSQVRTTAETILRRARALTETVALQIVPDASIELGDSFTAAVRGRQVEQCIAGFTLPLTASGVMTLECRSQMEAVQIV